jgi:hypothetical protein
MLLSLPMISNNRTNQNNYWSWLRHRGFLMNCPSKEMGFTLPFDHWLKNELSDFANQKINYLAHRSEFKTRCGIEQME